MDDQTLLTCVDTATESRYRDKAALAGIWRFILARNHQEASVHLCPFGVTLFLAKGGTRPLPDEPPGEDGRVRNWWELAEIAPEPRLRVTFRPVPEDGPDAVAAALGEASALSFEQRLAEEVFMRRQEDKGLVLLPVDLAFVPEPERLAAAWLWLDAYFAAFEDVAPAPPVFADGGTWNFAGREWHFTPQGMPPGCRFERMVFWTAGPEIFFAPGGDISCPFCGESAASVMDEALRALWEDGTDLSRQWIVTPCCGRKAMVNELEFQDEWFGVGRLSFRFTGWVRFPDEALAELGAVLGTRLKRVNTGL